jgi:hypothetical protein
MAMKVAGTLVGEGGLDLTPSLSIERDSISMLFIASFFHSFCTSPLSPMRKSFIHPWREEYSVKM